MDEKYSQIIWIRHFRWKFQIYWWKGKVLIFCRNIYPCKNVNIHFLAMMFLKQIYLFQSLVSFLILLKKFQMMLYLCTISWLWKWHGSVGIQILIKTILIQMPKGIFKSMIFLRCLINLLISISNTLKMAPPPLIREWKITKLLRV